MKKYLILFIVSISFSYAFIGCGSDNTVNPPTGNVGPYPKISMRSNSVYVFTNDTLTLNNSDTISTRTSVITTDVYQQPVIIEGYSALPIISTSVGGSSNIYDTMYVRYDSTNGKFYQFGITELIDTSSATKWDLVADFSVQRGQSWTLGNVVYPVSISIFNDVFTGPLTAKVADSLTITSSGSQGNINVYRIELLADMKGTNFPTVTFKVFIDYYIGFSNSTINNNPPGIVRIRLRPFNINYSFFNYPVTGFDRIIRDWTISQ